MWIPKEFTTAVCFLCTNNGEKVLFCGTAFFVAIPGADSPELAIGYLVTAQHCVRKAFDRYCNLSCRINTKGGGTKLIELPSPDSSNWFMSEDADVALLVLQEDESLEISAIPSQSFLTDDLMKKENIGLGDEVFLIGLFNLVHGRDRNYPIIRSGMIAMMPDEPLQDLDTGMEARSIGGLSGSPVFMALKKRGVEMRPTPRGFNPWTHSLVLVGLIRGHWDLENRDFLSESGEHKTERLNTGIAIVTPIQEVEKVLMSDEVRKERNAKIRALQQKNTPTNPR